jgi:hypothetical protein
MMQFSRRRFLRLTISVAGVGAVTRKARGQSYPTRPVHIVVGFPPGQAADISARLLGQWLSERLGQPFIIDNRPGAASTIATEQVVHASPFFPFLVRLVLPRAVIDFERILPATDMILIATPNVVLVRKDIHPALIDLLAQTIVEAHGKPGVFQQTGEFPTLIDPEYPVAQSARDFYKNGPSFMNRYQARGASRFC